MGCALALSVLLNLVAVLVVFIACFGLLTLKSSSLGTAGPLPPLLEQSVSGDRTATAKVAVVNLDSFILEGALSYVHRQIDQAARDKNVKAVVLRVNSPGGSITASDELHRRLAALVKGDTRKNTNPKPLLASFGPIAASGGYYVAMPAQKIFAERSTITGSIGVYASLPNVEALGNNFGFRMIVIKAGAIKDSGSPFKEMTPEERRVWQDMVDDAYTQFLDVVAAGRPKMPRAKLLERLDVKPLRPDPKARPNEPTTPYVRYRADGGIFTAPQAKRFGLVDDVGTLDDAIAAAAEAAELGDSYHAIKYQRPSTLRDVFLGTSATSQRPSESALDSAKLQEALAPRLWYLAPGYEAAGRVAATR